MGKVRALLLLALPMVLLPGTLMAQNDEMIKSVYKYNSSNYSLKIPDSVLEKLPLNQGSDNFTLNLGNVYYTNFYAGNFSKTEITFEATAGVRLTDEIKPTFFINDETNNLYFLFEDSIVIKKAKYFMPVLTKTNISDTVNGYLSSLYLFKNDNDISFRIWISTKIPWCVGPGFYFHNYGGITKVEYQHRTMLWSLDLDGFEKTNGNSEFKKSLVAPNEAKAEVFPFFDVKQ